MFAKTRRPPELDEDVVATIRPRSPSAARSGRWELLVAFFVVHILVPTTFYSYGVYFIYWENNDAPLATTIWTPTIFLAALSIFNCWSRELAESWIERGNGWGRWRACLGLLLAASGVSLSAFTTNPFWHVILNGLCGGIGTSLVLAHVNALVFDHFQSHGTLIRVMGEAAVAVGQFIVPHVLYMSIKVYGISDAPQLQGALILQALPAVLLLRQLRIGLPPQNSRYSDFQQPLALLYAEEMVEYPKESQGNPPIVQHLPTPNEIITEAPLLTQFHHWKSLSDIPDGDESVSIPIVSTPPDFDDADPSESDNDEDIDNTFPNASPSARRKNSCGVEILPEIPEESEHGSEHGEENSKTKDCKRFSKNLNRLSMQLEAIINREKTTEILPVNENTTTAAINTTNFETADQNGSISKWIRGANFHQRHHLFRFKCNCSPFHKYRVKKLYADIKNITYDFIGRPLIQSLQVLNFYPALCARISGLASFLIFFCCVPVFTRLTDRGVTQHEAVFMISITAFAWVVFIITTPWFADMSKKHLKYVYICGVVIETFAFLLLLIATTHEMITFASIIYGLGFGVTSHTRQIILKDALGTRNWTKVEGTLDTLSGIAVIVLICVVQSCDETMRIILMGYQCVCGLQFLTVLLWIGTIILGLVKGNVYVVDQNWENFISNPNRS